MGICQTIHIDYESFVLVGVKLWCIPCTRLQSWTEFCASLSNRLDHGKTLWRPSDTTLCLSAKFTRESETTTTWESSSQAVERYCLGMTSLNHWKLRLKPSILPLSLPQLCATTCFCLSFDDLLYQTLSMCFFALVSRVFCPTRSFRSLPMMVAVNSLSVLSE